MSVYFYKYFSNFNNIKNVHQKYVTVILFSYQMYNNFCQIVKGHSNLLFGIYWGCFIGEKFNDKFCFFVFFLKNTANITRPTSF